ncbi:hypothetical protein GCM10009665_75880 [Kitasatospora nipponensis]|uniref:Major facilitator superfamily (MFS) profile domain-containing protein n=1 Tax=Kitasatospora nipponensis TaxID=258049 RepID=A0ABN1T8S2_9ACTN
MTAPTTLSPGATVDLERPTPGVAATVAAVAAASALLPFSVTGAAVALPSMAAALGSSAGAAQWLLDAFNVGFAALPLFAGGLADRFGRRRVLRTGIALVATMSLLVALAPSMALADAARAVQGAGAAAVLAAGAAVLAASTTGRHRRLAFGVLGASFGAGLAIGPPVAGALVGAAGWRSVFLLVALLALPAWLASARAPEPRAPGRRSPGPLIWILPGARRRASLPQPSAGGAPLDAPAKHPSTTQYEDAPPARPAGRRGAPPGRRLGEPHADPTTSKREALDLPGSAAFTAGLLCLSLVFVRAADLGWTAPGTLLPLAAALALLAAFGVIEARRGERALFDVRLLRRPEFLAVVGQPFTVTLGFVVLLVYLPCYLQGVGGRGTLASGLLLLPLTAPVLLLPLPAGRLAARSSVRAVLTGASALIALGALLLTTLRPDAGWPELALPLLPFGVGVGLAFGVMDNAAVSTVPLDRAGAAAGLFNTLRITGESLAVAAAAPLFTGLTATRLRATGLSPATATDLAGQAVHGHPGSTHPAALADGFTDAFHTIGLALAALSALGALLTWLALRPSRAASPG